MDEKELAKQLNTYADAITGFAFVQGVGFGLVIGQNPNLSTSVARQWCIAAPIIFVMTCGYFVMVRRCHSAEDELIGAPDKRGKEIGKVVPTIRTTRLLLIAVIGFAEIVLAIALGLWTPRSNSVPEKNTSSSSRMSCSFARVG